MVTANCRCSNKYLLLVLTYNIKMDCFVGSVERSFKSQISQGTAEKEERYGRFERRLFIGVKRVMTISVAGNKNHARSSAVGNCRD